MKLTAFCLLLVGCAAPDPGAAGGQVVVALTTTDPGDGTLYRLPAGSRLQLDSGVYFDTFSLDGDTALVSINVPPGDYQARLASDAGYLDLWPLEHVLSDGSIDIVHAALATPMPAALSVPDGFSVSLVLSFRLAGGTITFGTGTVDVSVDVTTVGATGALISAAANLQTSTASVSASVPAAIAARLPAVGTDLVFSASARLVGAWTQRSSTFACAPALFDLGEGGNPAFDDLVREAAGTTEVCLGGGPGATPLLRLSFVRFGTPSTPTFAEATGNFTFETMVQGILPEGIFDGRTIDLTRLNGTWNLAASSITRVIAATTFETWYFGEHQGQLAITFIPTE